MNGFLLSPGVRLRVEPCAQGVRLIAVRSGEPQVCRKARRKELLELLKGRTERAFRGRLRLVRRGESVIVEVKGEAIGSASAESLRSAVDALRGCEGSIARRTLKNRSRN